MKNLLRLAMIMAIVTLGLCSSNGVMAQGSELKISVDGEIFTIEENEYIKSEGHYYIETEKLALILEMHIEVDSPLYHFIIGEKGISNDFEKINVSYSMLIEPDDAEIDYDPIGLNFIDISSLDYGLGSWKEYPTQVGKVRNGKAYASVRFLADCAYYDINFEVESNTIMLQTKEKHWAEPFQNRLLQFLSYGEPVAYFNLYDMNGDGYPELFIQWSGKVFYSHFNPFTGFIEYPREYDREETYIEPDGYYTTAIQEEFDLSELYGSASDNDWDLSDLDVWKYTIIRNEYEEGYNKVRDSLNENTVLIPLVPLTEEYIELVSKMKP